MTLIGLVDDDRSTQTLLKTLLELEGYSAEIFGQENEQAILAALELQPPDIIILDVHLRFADGLEIMRQIRQNHQLKDVLVIMSSGMDYSQRCAAAGANAFLMKPYMPDDLLAIIREQLAHHL
ncbi:MAG TPA: response regulator [Anaerolineaceae bacterium]